MLCFLQINISIHYLEEHPGRNLLLRLPTLHCNQALLLLICITAVCRVGEPAITVRSRRLRSKKKSLLQEIFHKTLSMGKELTAQGSELACWRSHNRPESELLGKSRVTDSIWPRLLNQSKEGCLPTSTEYNLSRLTAGVNQPNHTDISRDVFNYTIYKYNLL